MKGFDFGNALIALRMNLEVRRANWQNQKLSLSAGFGGERITLTTTTNVGGMKVESAKYNPSHEDIVAKDWEIIRNKN